MTDIQTNVEAKSVVVTHGDSVSKQEMLEKLQKVKKCAYLMECNIQQILGGCNDALSNLLSTIISHIHLNSALFPHSGHRLVESLLPCLPN